VNNLIIGDVNQEEALSGYVEAGDFFFLSYCLEIVYPARETISTDFAHVGGPDGLHVQIDGIAYKGKKE
jgi:hypothetical protein